MTSAATHTPEHAEPFTVTRKAAAMRLGGISDTTLRRLERDEGLESRRVGRRVLYRESDIERLRETLFAPPQDPRERAALAALASGARWETLVLEHGYTLDEARRTIEQYGELAREHAASAGYVLLSAASIEMLRRIDALPRDVDITSDNLAGLLAGWVHDQRAAMKQEIDERVARGLKQSTQLETERIRADARIEVERQKSLRATRRHDR